MERARLSRGAAGVIVLLAVAAIAVSVVALHRDDRDRTRIRQLETTVRKLAVSAGGVTVAMGRRVSGFEGRLATLQAAETVRAGKQAKLEASLARLVSCVPELQTELAALGTKAKGKASAIHVSKACSSVLTPAPSKTKPK